MTVRTLLAKCDDYQFQILILQFPALGKNYRIAGMFIITRAISTPREVELGGGKEGASRLRMRM